MLLLKVGMWRALPPWERRRAGEAVPEASLEGGRENEK